VLALRDYDDNEISNLITDEIDQKTESNNDLKKIQKLGHQIERYSKHTARFFENFERNLENIACADTIEEFNIAVGCYNNQNTMMNKNIDIEIN
jgi:aspartokinase